MQFAKVFQFDKIFYTTFVLDQCTSESQSWSSCPSVTSQRGLFCISKEDIDVSIVAFSIADLGFVPRFLYSECMKNLGKGLRYSGISNCLWQHSYSTVT